MLAGREEALALVRGPVLHGSFDGKKNSPFAWAVDTANDIEDEVTTVAVGPRARLPGASAIPAGRPRRPPRASSVPRPTCGCARSTSGWEPPSVDPRRSDDALTAARAAMADLPAATSPNSRGSPASSAGRHRCRAEIGGLRGGSPSPARLPMGVLPKLLPFSLTRDFVASHSARNRQCRGLLERRRVGCRAAAAASSVAAGATAGPSTLPAVQVGGSPRWSFAPHLTRPRRHGGGHPRIDEASSLLSGEERSRSFVRVHGGGLPAPGPLDRPSPRRTHGSHQHCIAQAFLAFGNASIAVSEVKELARRGHPTVGPRSSSPSSGCPLPAPGALRRWARRRRLCPCP